MDIATGLCHSLNTFFAISNYPFANILNAVSLSFLWEEVMGIVTEGLCTDSHTP